MHLPKNLTPEIGERSHIYLDNLMEGIVKESNEDFCRSKEIEKGLEKEESTGAENELEEIKGRKDFYLIVKILIARIRGLVSGETCVSKTQSEYLDDIITDWSELVHIEPNKTLAITNVIECSRFNCHNCLKENCDDRQNDIEEVKKRAESLKKDQDGQ